MTDDEWQEQLNEVVNQFAEFMEDIESQGFDRLVILQALTATMATGAIEYETDEYWLADTLVKYVQKIRPVSPLSPVPAEA
jgi:hypothetical protein